MAFVHGKDGAFSWANIDLSDFVTSVSFSPSADSHDVTTFGKNAHVFQGGLLTGTIDVEGIFDNDSNGPRAALMPNIGKVDEFEWQPEGAGSNKAQSAGNALLLGYDESAPVADMITWTARFQISDEVNHAVQSS